MHPVKGGRNMGRREEDRKGEIEMEKHRHRDRRT